MKQRRQLLALLALVALFAHAAAQLRGPPLAPQLGSQALPGPLVLADPSGPEGSSGPGPVPGGGGGDAKEGSLFTNEAIRQAQNSYLIPKDATIQKVQEGMEVAAFEHIPGEQRINLFEILGAHVPPEVVNNLQAQLDQVGKQ